MSQVIKQGANPAIPMGMKPPQQAIPSRPAPSLPINSFKPPAIAMRGSSPAIVMPNRPPIPKTPSLPPTTPTATPQLTTTPTAKTIQPTQVTVTPQAIQLKLAPPTPTQAEIQYVVTEPVVVDDPFAPPSKSGNPPKRFVGWKTTIYSASDWAKVASRYQNQQITTTNAGVVKPIIQPVVGQIPNSVLQQITQQNTLSAQAQAVYQNIKVIQPTQMIDNTTIPNVSPMYLVKWSDGNWYAIGWSGNPQKELQQYITDVLANNTNNWTVRNGFILTRAEARQMDDLVPPAVTAGVESFPYTLDSRLNTILFYLQQAYTSAGEPNWFSPFLEGQQTKNGYVVTLLNKSKMIFPSPTDAKVWVLEHWGLGPATLNSPEITPIWTVRYGMQTQNGFEIALNGMSVIFRDNQQALQWLQAYYAGKNPPLYQYKGQNYGDQGLFINTILSQGQSSQNGFTITLPDGTQLTFPNKQQAQQWLQNYVTGQNPLLYQYNGKVYGDEESFLLAIVSNGQYTQNGFTITLPDGTTMTFANQQQAFAWLQTWVVGYNAISYRYNNQNYGDQLSLMNAILSQGQSSQNGFTITLPDGTQMTFSNKQQAQQWLQNYLSSQKTQYYQYQGQEYGDRSSFINAILSQGKSTQNGFTITLPDGTQMTFSNQQQAQQWLQNYIAGQKASYYQYQGQEYGDLNSLITGIISQGQSTQNGFVVTLPDGTKMTFSNKQDAQQWLQNYMTGKVSYVPQNRGMYYEGGHQFLQNFRAQPAAAVYQYNGQYYGDLQSYIQALQNLIQGPSPTTYGKLKSITSIEAGGAIQATQLSSPTPYSLPLDNKTTVYFSNKQAALQFVQDFVAGKAQLYQFNGKYYGDLTGYQNAVLAAMTTLLQNSIKPVQFSHGAIESGAAPTGVTYQLQTDAGTIYFSSKEAAELAVQQILAGTFQAYNINGKLYGDPIAAQTAYLNALLASNQISNQISGQISNQIPSQISKVTSPVLNFSNRENEHLPSYLWVAITRTNQELMGSYKVTVGGQTIGYFATQSDAQKALNDYLQYLSGGPAPKWYAIPTSGNLLNLYFPTQQSFTDYLMNHVQKIGSDYYLNISSFGNPDNPLANAVQTQTYKFTSSDQAQKFINVILNPSALQNTQIYTLNGYTFVGADAVANYLNGKYLITDNKGNIVAIFNSPPTQDQLAQYGIYTNATPQGTGMLFVQTFENLWQGALNTPVLGNIISFMTTGNPTPPKTQPQTTYQLINPNQVTWQVQNGNIIPQAVPQQPAPIGANYLPWMGFAGTLLTGLYRTPEMLFAASNLLANTATNLKFQAQQAGQSLYTTGINRMGEAFILNTEGILAAIGGSALAFLGGLTSIVNPNALASANLPTPYWLSAGAGVLASLFVGGDVADFLQTFKLGRTAEAVGEVATTTKIAESGIPILKQGETVGQILGKDILVGGKAVLPTTEGVTTILKPTLFTRIGAALRSLEDIRIGGVTARSLTDLSVGGGLMVGLNSVLTGHLPTSVGEALSEFETGALYSVGFIPVSRVLGRLGAVGSRLAAGPTYGMINVGLGILQGENNPQSLARSFLLGFGLAYAGDIATGLVRGIGKVATKISDVYHSIPRAPDIMLSKNAVLEAKISEVLGQQGIKPIDTEARGSFPVEQLNFLENIMPEEKVQGQEPFATKPTWFTRVTLIPAYGRWFANELVDAFRSNVLSKLDIFRPRATETPDFKAIDTTPHPLNYLEAYQDLLSWAGNRYPRMLLDKFAEWREVPEELRIFTPSELDMWRNYEFITNFDRIPKAFSDLANRFSRFGERFSKGAIESLNEAYKAQLWLSRDLREPIPEDVMKQLIRQNRPLTWREQMSAVLDSLPKLELPELGTKDLATQVKEAAARTRANKVLSFLPQLETSAENIVKTFTESIKKEEKPELLQPKEKPTPEGKEVQSGSSTLIVLPKEEEVKSTGLTSEQVKDIVDTISVLKEKGYEIEDIIRGLLAKGYTPEQLEQLLFKAMMKLPNLTDQEYARLSSFLVGQKRVTTEELKPPEYKSPYPKLYQRGRYSVEYQFLTTPPNSPWGTQTEERRPSVLLPSSPTLGIAPIEVTQTRPNLALGLGLGLGSFTSQIQRPRFILNILEELTPIVSSIPAPTEVATTITSQVTLPWRIPIQTPWSDIFLTPLLSQQTTPTQIPIITPTIIPTTVPTETPTETPTQVPILSPQNIEIIIPRDKLKQPGPPPPPQQNFGVTYTPRRGVRSPFGYNYGLLVHRISENIVADFGAVVQNLVRGVANSNVIRMSRGFHDPGVIFMSRGFRSSAPILMSKGFHDPAIIRMSRGFASRLPISMRRTFVNPFSFVMDKRGFRSTFPINARTQFSVQSLSFFNPNQKRKPQIAQPLTNPLTNIAPTNVFAKNYRAITQGIIGSVNA